MKKALKISTTGEVEVIDFEQNTLEVLQSAVGGWIEAIYLPSIENATMWLNEEGKLIGLPHNSYAQTLWNAEYGKDTDYIVGNVVITGGVDDEGESLGLADITIASLTEMVEMLKQSEDLVTN